MYKGRKQQASRAGLTTNCRLIVKFIGCFLNSAKSAPDVETVSGLKKVLIKTRMELSIYRGSAHKQSFSPWIMAVQRNDPIAKATFVEIVKYILQYIPS